jgi:hypothetical protein
MDFGMNKPAGILGLLTLLVDEPLVGMTLR